MANINAPFGFKLITGLGSYKPNVSVRQYVHAATDATGIFVGDMVKLVSGSELNGTMIVTAAGANDAYVGNVVGINPFYGVSIDNLNLNRIYCPGNVRMMITVCDDPLAVYEVQTPSTFTVAQIGLYANLIATAGSTTTGQSNYTLNTANSTATNQFQIIGNVLSPDNELGTGYTRVLVRCNKHSYAV